MIRLFLLTALCVLANASFAQTNPNSILPGAPCHGQEPCALDGREYHVKEPDGWDGMTPLPVLLHFHGWARTGKVPVYHTRISGATRRRDVLLVAPTGLNKTWNFRQDRSYDVAFADAVLADVAKRYAIDPTRIYVSGYSFGGLMAWRFACESGNDIAAMMSISAALNALSCDEAPTEMRQVYGLRDNVLDFPFGPDGDTTQPVRLWRDIFGCAEDGTNLGEWSATGQRVFTRTVWDCGENKVTLDLHPGGHLIPRGWIAQQLDELLSLEPA